MKTYERLLSRVEITRECRYAAEKRLNRRNDKAYYVISLLSLFVIVVSVLPNVHDFDDAGLQWLLMITIINSVFIIVTTLVDVAGNYALNEFHMRQSARKLDLVLNQLILATDKEKCDSKWLLNMHEVYQEVLHDCPTDHKPVDHLAVMVQMPSLFSKRWESQSRSSQMINPPLRFLSLHFTRGKWMIPHVLAVLFSIGLIAEIWTPDRDVLGLGLMNGASEKMDLASTTATEAAASEAKTAAGK